MSDDPSVLAAVATAVASLGVALISLRKANRANALAAKTQIEVEQVRTQGAYRLEALKLGQPLWEQSSHALSDAWMAIPIVRDSLNKFVGPAAYDADVLREKLLAHSVTLSEG